MSQKIKRWPVWTEERVERLIKEYPNRKTSDLAKDLGLSLDSVRSKALSMSIKKTDDFMKSAASGRIIEGDNDPRLVASRVRMGNNKESTGETSDKSIEEPFVGTRWDVQKTSTGAVYRMR